MTGFESFQFLRPGWLVLIIPGCWLVFRLHQRWRKRTDWSGVVEPHLLSIPITEREFSQTEIENFPKYSVYVDRSKVPSGLAPICIKNRSDHTNYFLGGIGFDGNALNS